MGLSRNKVAVPEGAAGSPPFYGEFSRMFVRWCAPRASHGAMAAGLLVWKTSLALPCRSCGGCGVVWMRFWAPGSPPQAFCLARFDARRAWGPADNQNIIFHNRRNPPSFGIMSRGKPLYSIPEAAAGHNSFFLISPIIHRICIFNFSIPAESGTMGKNSQGVQP